MIRAEHLRLWQPQADEAQLADFVAENTTLLTLLAEAWDKHAAAWSAAHTPAVPPPEYAAQMRVEDLRHDALTEAEMAAFTASFGQDGSGRRADRPFGDHVRINEQDWELLPTDRS